MTRHRRAWLGIFVVAALVAACGDDGGGGEVTLEDVEPIVAVEPCDLLDPATAEDLAGAEVTEPEEVVEEDGTTSCSFGFADEDVAETAGSDIAALLEIGPGDEGDVPGGGLARALDMGDAAAVEEAEDKVTVVYVVQTVVVVVEVAPGSGEVTPDLVDDVVDFAETTEPVITEAVTGEPFVPRTTSSTTTTFVDDDVPEGDVELEVDGDPVELSFDRPGGDAVATFEAEAGDALFFQFPTVTYADPDGSCLRVTLIDPEDATITGTCISQDGSTILDRQELRKTGVYQLELTGDATQTGSVEILVTRAIDGEGTVQVDGPTATATVQNAGAQFTLEVELAANQGIFLAFPRVVYGDPEGVCLRATLVNPDGGVITGTCISQSGETFLDIAPVAAAGTYQIVIDGDVTQTGEVDVQVTATD